MLQLALHRRISHWIRSGSQQAGRPVGDKQADADAATAVAKLVGEIHNAVQVGHASEGTAAANTTLRTREQMQTCKRRIASTGGQAYHAPANL